MQIAGCDIGSDHHDHLEELGAYRSGIHAVLGSIQLRHKTRSWRIAPHTAALGRALNTSQICTDVY